jgi:hypothetical protein
VRVGDDPLDPAVAQVDDAVRHAGDGGVVGDDDRGGADLVVDAGDDLEDELAGLVVERPGRLVAEQHLGPLDDGAGDGDALLLAAGELRRKVVAPRRQADPVDRLVDRHRVLDDVGDQGDVLAHRQARDQVVELEHEADVAAPDTR